MDVVANEAARSSTAASAARELDATTWCGGASRSPPPPTRSSEGANARSGLVLPSPLVLPLRPLESPLELPSRGFQSLRTMPPPFLRTSRTPQRVTAKKNWAGYSCLSMRWRRRALGEAKRRGQSGWRQANCAGIRVSGAGEDGGRGKGTDNFLASFAADESERVVALCEVEGEEALRREDAPALGLPLLFAWWGGCWLEGLFPLVECEVEVEVEVEGRGVADEAVVREVVRVEARRRRVHRGRRGARRREGTREQSTANTGWVSIPELEKRRGRAHSGGDDGRITLAASADDDAPESSEASESDRDRLRLCAASAPIATMNKKKGWVESVGSQKVRGRCCLLSSSLTAVRFHPTDPAPNPTRCTSKGPRISRLGCRRVVLLPPSTSSTADGVACRTTKGRPADLQWNQGVKVWVRIHTLEWKRKG